MAHRRYPTQSNGLVVSPYEIGFNIPTQEAMERRGQTNNHHAYFSRRMYEDAAYKRVFRNLVANVYPLYVGEHNSKGGLHSVYGPPKVPEARVMLDFCEEELALNGFLTCIKEKDTNEQKIILPHQWEGIKREYRNVLARPA